MTTNSSPENQMVGAQAWAPKLDASGNVQPYNVYEAEIFRFALAQAGGCVSRAAELLQVGRATMYRKMRAYSIIAPPVSERAIDRSRREKVEVVAQAPAVVEAAVDLAPQAARSEIAA
jgi:hypothetical protein